MNAKHLITTLSWALAAGAAAAALSRSAVPPAKPTPAGERGEQASEGAIPRIVVTARRNQADGPEAGIARVIVTGHRPGEVQALAAARP